MYGSKINLAEREYINLSILKDHIEGSGAMDSNMVKVLKPIKTIQNIKVSFQKDRSMEKENYHILIRLIMRANSKITSFKVMA